MARKRVGSALKLGDRVQVTDYKGGRPEYFNTRTGAVVANVEKSWSGYGGFWRVALDDGFEYGMYESEITKIEEAN